MTQREDESFDFGFMSSGRREAKCLEELFRDYGIRVSTLAKMTELGFTVSTLLNMTEQELEDIINAMIETYRIDLLVGERYGIKAAIRAERRLINEEAETQRLRSLCKSEKKRKQVEDALNEGAKENGNLFLGGSIYLDTDDPVLTGQQSQSLTTGVLALRDHSSESDGESHGKKKQKRRRPRELGDDGEDRPREHPFIVTEPGELARGKKNGLDYLFDLYEQCGRFLEEVQHICRERGEKCPTKVTNQVFRHAKHTGASYINKPKMRHYVHCYALHCLDTNHSNHLRKLFKDRGENVGAWRQACYYPLVELARANNWDIEGVFNRNDKLRIWYVPTRLRQLCHIEKSKESS